MIAQKKKNPGAPFLAFFARSGIECDKNDYRVIRAGLEGVSGKKAVDSETMTVKNEKKSREDSRCPASETRRH